MLIPFSKLTSVQEPFVLIEISLYIFVLVLIWWFYSSIAQGTIWFACFPNFGYVGRNAPHNHLLVKAHWSITWNLRFLFHRPAICHKDIRNFLLESALSFQFLAVIPVGNLLDGVIIILLDIQPENNMDVLSTYLIFSLWIHHKLSLQIFVILPEVGWTYLQHVISLCNCFWNRFLMFSS